jgi:hypothetical protein
MINVDKVPARDWNLYFGGVYMQYRGTLAYVRPYAYQDPEEGRTRTTLRVQREGMKDKFLWRKGDLKELLVWWPRAGAYNIRGSAVYVARKATRSMKKSCCPDSHYYVKWGAQGMSPARYLTLKNHHFDTWEAAKQAIDNGKHARALSRNLIVANSAAKGVYQLVYRGDEVGTLEGSDYHPLNELSPLTKLVYQELIEEGVVC